MLRKVGQVTVAIKTMLNSKKVVPYIFLFPFIAFFLIFRLWPIVWSFLISFTSYFGGDITFIGIDNYIELFKDRVFWKSVGNTFYFVIIYNVIMIFVAIVMAVIVSSPKIRGRRIYRSIYFMPMAMMLPVVAIVFDLIFAKNIGLISSVFNVFGAELDVRWFGDMKLAMWGVIIMRVWRGVGYYCAYFLAGLAGISDDVYEAADIDGSGAITTFFKITLPLLKPMLMFVVIMSTILSFQIFDEPWILTQGGPANSTLTLQMYLYQTSFLDGNLSKGSAVAYIMTLFMMFFSIMYVKQLSEKE
ncbi:lactose/L-arabinose transport system permease protein [Ruminiclostridium sufflavum DSM 19573]|uniref:Lactose/L-arabinose transport system permease protein n=1 Tax=Ruminiclostridium sufflavum DSM 19573 TaxID=1121337 RepID=A0A318XKZ4_9FIRM|nr:sugar ABC transporter permease [Ruminiclostridium sufflavum]PYG85764.1 lactose/L-arabinose transport system permease protein [Ruminiclostridium sufflavum DSM 19573]